MSKALCIYHGNCADGFGAAWVVRKSMEIFGMECDFHAGVYQRDPPDVKGRDVIIVDFSYKRPVMEKILAEAATVTILDHHKTAIEDIKDLHFSDSVFDTERSGAMLAWDYFFPYRDAPMLLQHIQDRDLWRFKLLGTREIQAALFSFPYDFEVWTDLMERHAAISELLAAGVAIERKHFKDIRELLSVCRVPMKIAGFDVLAANLPYTLSSDAGHIICEEEKDSPFGCCFYDGPDGRNFSLRSIDSKQDVSEIAKRYGGGGHRNAAGFRVSFEMARAMQDDAFGGARPK